MHSEAATEGRRAADAICLRVVTVARRNIVLSFYVKHEDWRCCWLENWNWKMLLTWFRNWGRKEKDEERNFLFSLTFFINTTDCHWHGCWPHPNTVTCNTDNKKTEDYNKHCDNTTYCTLLLDPLCTALWIISTSMENTDEPAAKKQQVQNNEESKSTSGTSSNADQQTPDITSPSDDTAQATSTIQKGR